MLTTAQKAKYVHELVYKVEKSTHQKYINALIEQAGVVAMRDAWKNEYQNAMGLEVNPYVYKAELAAEKVLAAYDEWDAMTQVLKFTIDHFLNMIKE